MATIVLSAVGMAAGSALGGNVLGLSTALIGRAVGATIGRVIDQKIMGSGSDVVEHGKVDRFRLSGASEGAPVAQLHGRVRVAGQVIWATRFHERVSTSGGSGKGGPPKPKVREYSYSVSLAIALCEGEITGIGRVWADGRVVSADDLNMRVYTGSEGQDPDPKIEAVEGAGFAPAYRGVAYVVLEDIDLGGFGNRVPQFSFEVLRPASAEVTSDLPEVSEAVRAVALMPGTGEYALATTPVHLELGPGENKSVNVNSPSGKSDMATSIDALRSELPNCSATSLIVSWFGDDLRCGLASLKPKVEQKVNDGKGMPWSVSGVTRINSEVIAEVDGRPVYGGTPADQSVIEAIKALQAAGQAVTFYPFILMEQLEGNGRTDPWAGADDQPVLPWRGRITLSVAPGQPGSPDQTAAADNEVAAFFGTAAVNDFVQTPNGVNYSGPAEWSFRRFILHYAHLCAVAGGVEAFCIGSEMRGLTQIRGANGFPSVDAMKALAADVRSILGPDCKIGYAADWSEYFGYHPQDGSGDVYFHLDPLWADANIDFIGIDNYMPLSDWRDGLDHADAAWGSIYNLDYLTANVAGGEGYDWHYDGANAEKYQNRTPISDGAYDEDWVFRYKDLRSWWSSPHYNRIGGIRGQLISNGAQPASWSAVGGATVSPESDGPTLAQFPSPARVTDANGTYLSSAKSASFAATEGVTHEFRVFYTAGTTQLIRITLPFSGQSIGTSWIYVIGAPGSLNVSLNNAHTVSPVENVDHGNGVWECRFSVTWADTDTVLQLMVGPGFNDAGEYMLLLGASVTSQTESATAWVPQSKPYWFTELGCAAIDKGTNQPNKFLDPKSSESKLPKFSNGRRDDFIQMQYLRAMMSFWTDAANNPVSEVYGSPMVDIDKAHVWAWDARPYPYFPGNTDLWSDGDNYAKGHWLNGRGAARSLAGLVAEICRKAGLNNYDVSELYGIVRGYTSGDAESARAALQPLMLAYGFDVIERNGELVFQTRSDKVGALLDLERLAVSPEAETDLLMTRAPAAEVAGRLRLSYVEADAEFATRAAEAVFPDEATHAVSQSELPLVLTHAEARAIVERWLAEARVARDTAKFALPPSQLSLRAGDVVTIPGEGGGAEYRIDRVEQAGLQILEAVRVEPEIYVPSDSVEVAVRPKAFVPPVPVYPIFLDLPLLQGDEVEHAPYIAASARPWPGSVAVYGSASDDGYQLNRLLSASAVVGTTETPLHAAKAGLIDRGAVLRVKIVSGELAATSLTEMLNGANAAAIGDGSSANWEVFQFTEATLVAERTYDISGRLRGQAGTDGVMPEVWPQGSIFVLLDGAPQQIDLALSARGLARHYRIGPAQRGYDDPSYVHKIEAFDGNGLRPYAPVHLRAAADGAGNLELSWVRRTRIDGDSWQSMDVPLGEGSEVYLVQVLQNEGVVREATVLTPSWAYTAMAQAADSLSGAFEIAVAQVSDRFGPGPFRRITINE